MATIIFDFDSTLVSCESLEVILQRKLQGRPEAAQAVHEITQKGIRGLISFSESLSQRLEVAAPSKKDVEFFGKNALEYITPNMQTFIYDLQSKGVDIWVVSGAIYESILPVCQQLNIDLSQVHAVKLLWDYDGQFRGIDPKDPFSRSKLEGVRSLATKWRAPTIVIGDAMSDYQLYNQKIAEYFILYTEHLACQNVINLGVDTAKNVQELKEKIDVLIEKRPNQNFTS